MRLSIPQGEYKSIRVFATLDQMAKKSVFPAPWASHEQLSPPFRRSIGASHAIATAVSAQQASIGTAIPI
jgi:hypothetical protein